MKILQGVKNIVVQKNLKTDKFKRKKYTQKTRTKKERKGGTSMILYSKRNVFLHVLYTCWYKTTSNSKGLAREKPELYKLKVRYFGQPLLTVITGC